MSAGDSPWLAELPTELRVTLPDGTRLLGVHAAPGRDDGPGINPLDADNHPGRAWLIAHQRGEVKPRPGGP